MTIFRGVGGGGNSTTDSEITLLTSLAAEASASATLAGLSSAASGVSASNAAASEAGVALSATNAATSASTAVTQASNASTSASAASASASTASTQATNASNSATSASTSASTATTQVSLANSAAALATTKATASGNSALAASLSASTASTQASNAASSSSSASTSATNASNSATAASGSASTASTQASNASTSASNASSLTSSASGYATNALNSANAAANSAASVPADATLVHKTGNETIAGIKTFSSAPFLAGATLVGTVAGGGNQINNVVIGASTPLAGSFTTLSATEIITANKGITFPAAQVASSNANTLDDYEEGSFLPTISGTTAAGTGTYITQVAIYTKIGRIVTFQLNISWSAHTGTGNIVIEGLPFTSYTVTSTQSAATIGYADGVAFTAGGTLIAYLQTNSTQVQLRQIPSGGGTVASVPMDTAGALFISGTYSVN
jgi:hypothetical protein